MVYALFTVNNEAEYRNGSLSWIDFSKVNDSLRMPDSL